MRAQLCVVISPILPSYGINGTVDIGTSRYETTQVFVPFHSFSFHPPSFTASVFGRRGRVFACTEAAQAFWVVAREFSRALGQRKRFLVRHHGFCLR